MITVPVRCVVDASVGIKQVVAEPDSHQAQALFAHLAQDPAAVFYVPDFFFLECTNILWKLVGRKNLTATQAKTELLALKALRFTVIPVTDLTDDALDIAVAQDISAYDAAYLAASAQRKAPLITADDKLARKVASTTVGSPAYTIQLLSALTIPTPPTPPSP
jgi:predicted nucleic acid-binding protein